MLVVLALHVVGSVLHLMGGANPSAKEFEQTRAKWLEQKQDDDMKMANWTRFKESHHL
jgi:hypothetical protein